MVGEDLGLESIVAGLLDGCHFVGVSKWFQILGFFINAY